MSFIQPNEIFRGDFDVLDSLDSEASRRLFIGFPERKPSLEMALRAAKIKDHDIILEDSYRYADAAKKDPEIAKLGLSDDEAGAISCYTLQGTDDEKSPYQVINEGLVGSRDRARLVSTRRLLFLLLSGLRKLPRTRPSTGQIFYRGIRAKVPQTKGEATKTDENGMTVTNQYYEEGRTVTWWGFTSTTTSMEVANNFIRNASKAGTVFHIGGEDLWGYVIKAFSQYPKEDEILLEPEAKVFVKGSKNLGAFLTIEVTLQPFNHLVLEDIIPVGNVFPKKRWECVWKKCPDDIDDDRKYSVDKKNPRIATKVNNDDWCTIIGNTYIHLNAVTSWSIKILKSKNNGGNGIVIGIAPNDINQNVCNYDKCGWYFDCYDSTLCSGPPHNYSGKEYGPRKGDGQYVHTGDCVGVVVDTTKGELSFVLNGVNLGVAFEGIPLDKPLVPCALLGWKGDSVELDLSEVKKNEVDSSIPVSPNITVKSTTWDSITLVWDDVIDTSLYQIEVNGSKSWDATTTNLFVKRGLLTETEYNFRVRTVRGSSVSEWSDVAKGRTLKAPEFSECVWKECPGDVGDKRKYSVDRRNPRVATKVNGGNDCTIIGNTYIPLNTVTSWNIKVLESWDNDGDSICIGVAPSDINQNGDDNNYNGWYFGCWCSKLCSGPPHNYRRGKEYGPRKGNGQYVHTGDSVGVVMDTTKGELSFVLSGVNCGAAYCGIPLDKPLVPCVILGCQGDSVEFDTSEVKETVVDSSISVPLNITAKSITWDSITLTWDKDEDASLYEIEVDGSKSPEPSTKNSFTKGGLLPETEHGFRVRTGRGSSVSEWSGVVKGRTLKAPEFSECVWKECPDDGVDQRKYSVDVRNPRIATMINNDDWCTIIGNTYIPLNTVAPWNIKVLKSRNKGDSILIGIAPFDINQNDVNFKKCGWYFDCYYSTLYSGPPHSYHVKEYGPRKGGGQYVHTGDSVGVVMDTTNGDLSFALNEVNLSVAYDGIPLDKPLVPCVLLGYQGDSVELDLSEVKKNEVDSSIPAPSNTTVKSTTWDSITLAWDDAIDTSFYQVEVDGSKLWGSSTTNSFTKCRLLAETEHSFRVRTVRGSSVSEWSGVVKGRTLKAPEFSECVWKECPDGGVGQRKYSVDRRNLRIATKDGSNGHLCTIIGNTPIPLNTVTSWNIKVLESMDDNGFGIYAGISPFDINQNVANHRECGWYFYCYGSLLYSGPPHSYRGKEYGPRKGGGQYVHTGDSVGVVMDTIKGELSFVLDGVNRGIAYEGIPLDKPLVPCVLLSFKGDSIELVI